MSEETQTKKVYGAKHWLFQTIPPLLLFGIVFASDKGTATVYLAGIFVIPVLVSVISVIAKLIFYKKRKYYLLRPLLTIALFFAVIVITHWTYEGAREDAIAAARQIHDQCNIQTQCPATPVGWEDYGSRARADFGWWLKYPTDYYRNEDTLTFTIRVYQGPDLGDVITGGVDVKFKIERYKDG